jgi:hypothetical protein
MQSQNVNCIILFVTKIIQIITNHFSVSYSQPCLEGSSLTAWEQYSLRLASSCMTEMHYMGMRSSDYRQYSTLEKAVDLRKRKICARKSYHLRKVGHISERNMDRKLEAISSGTMCHVL